MGRCLRLPIETFMPTPPPSTPPCGKPLHEWRTQYPPRPTAPQQHGRLQLPAPLPLPLLHLLPPPPPRPSPSFFTALAASPPPPHPHPLSLSLLPARRRLGLALRLALGDGRAPAVLGEETPPLAQRRLPAALRAAQARGGLGVQEGVVGGTEPRASHCPGLKRGWERACMGEEKRQQDRGQETQGLEAGGWEGQGERHGEGGGRSGTIACRALAKLSGKDLHGRRRRMWWVG